MVYRIFQAAVLCSLLGLLVGCESEVEKVYPGNNPPPDSTISSSTQESYVSKVYISLLGRKPDSLAFSAALAALRANNFSEPARLDFVRARMSDRAYHSQSYEMLRRDFLNELDSASVVEAITMWDEIANNPDQRPDFREFAQKASANLRLVDAIPGELAAGTIEFTEAERRIADNFFYDEINMGTENFVVSCFDNFLLRYPTQYELIEGKKIVDFEQGLLFGVPGYEKVDFLRIFFNSSQYKAGLVRRAYQRLLFRDPTEEEAEAFAQTFDQPGLQTRLMETILTSEEYVYR